MRHLKLSYSFLWWRNDADRPGTIGTLKGNQLHGHTSIQKVLEKGPDI